MEFSTSCEEYARMFFKGYFIGADGKRSATMNIFYSGMWSCLKIK